MSYRAHALLLLLAYTFLAGLPVAGASRTAAPVRPATESLAPLGQIGGTSKAVAVQGAYAYLGLGPRLAIFDLTSPLTPTLAGQTAVLPGVVGAVAVQGNYAYVATEATLFVADVSNPAAPAIVSELALPATPASIGDIAVAGDYAYVADWTEGLRIVNIANPAAPVEAGAHVPSGVCATGVAVAGNYAYITDGHFPGLRIVDVSTPAAPVEVAGIVMPYFADDVAVADQRAYVADGGGGMYIVDVSDPPHPEVLAHLSGIQADAIAVSGDYAYVLYCGFALVTIDVSDPAHPTAVDTLPLDGQAIAVAGAYAYAAERDGGVYAVNRADPAHPALGVHVDLPGKPYAVKAAGTGVYIQDGRTTLRVIDATDPSALQMTGSVALPPEPGDTPYGGLDVAWPYVYVADGYAGGLQIVDVSDANHPFVAGAYNPGTDWIQGVVVSGTHAYLSDWQHGLAIVDVSDPFSPTLVTYYPTPIATGLAITGNLLAIADGGFGVDLLNVSDPAHPVQVGDIGLPAPREIAFTGRYLYVADAYEALWIIDVADPTAPVPIGCYCQLFGPPMFGHHLALGGDFAFLTDDFALLLALDVTAPATPYLAAYWHSLGEPGVLTAIPPHVYLSVGQAGLLSLTFAPTHTHVLLPLVAAEETP